MPPPPYTPGSYGSFHSLPSPGSPLLGAAHVDPASGAPPNKRRTGRFIAFLVVVVLAALALRAYGRNETKEELGKERMRWRGELAKEREGWREEKEGWREEEERWKEELRRELERWERALGRNIPQGTFWDGVRPAADCRAYDTREYWEYCRTSPMVGPT